jgi:predicted MFS family arabinose efflux permease
MTLPASGPAPVVTAGGSRLVLLAAGMFAIGTDAFVIAPLLARIARDLDIGIAAAAQLITAYALAYALCSPFVATLTAHWRRERAVVTGLAVFAGANVAAAMAPGFAAVLAARAFAGLGAALFAPAASASAASLAAADRRGRALSIMMIGLSSATALGSPLGTVIGTVLSWRAVFLLVAIFAAAVAVAILATIRTGVEMDGASIGQRLRPLREPGVVVTLLVTFLVLTGLYISYT